MEVTWTKELPKGEGYYWLKDPDSEPQIVSITLRQPTMPNVGFSVWYIGNESEDFLDQKYFQGSEWSGPLQWK